MKSIRELTMGTEKDEPKVTTFGGAYSSGYDRGYDPYDDYWKTGYTGKTSYPQKQSGLITISMIINNDEIGPCADENSASYDDIKAENKATEIMYDKVEELLGRNYEANYTIQFQVIPGYGEYEGLAILTPNK